MIALFIAAVTALGAVTASAQDYVNIVVANGVVARIRTGGSYGSIYDRETRINQRIVVALSKEDMFPPKMRVYQSSGLWTVAVGDTMLIEVYSQDAAGAGTDTKTLAYQWKENFAARLPLGVSPVRVPPGWTGPKPGDDLASEPLPSGLPPEDEPLVTALVREMQKIRTMGDEQFQSSAPALEAGVLAMVATYRQPTGCIAPPTEFRRVQSLFKVLRGTEMNDQKFAINKKMYAGQTIEKIRQQFQIPAGTGPIPSADEIQMPVGGGPVIPVAPSGIAPPVFVPGTPIAKALLGSGLDPNNHLLNPGQQFAADAAQVMLYLQVAGAPNNTMVEVTMRIGDEVIGKRRLNLSGDRTLAITFYPETADRFTAGDYVCEITVNDQTAVTIPFRIGTP